MSKRNIDKLKLQGNFIKNHTLVRAASVTHKLWSHLIFYVTKTQLNIPFQYLMIITVMIYQVNKNKRMHFTKEQCDSLQIER